MADDQFFNDVQDALGGDETPVEEVVEKIKVGEDEYTQEELNRLVGLGKIGAEAEEKYDIKIDKIWPNTQKTINENKELRERESAREAAAIQEKADAGTALSPDELKKQALAQARDLGIVTKEDLAPFLDDYYSNRRAGEELLNQVNSLVGEAEKDGKPKVTSEKLLQYMSDEGIRKPEAAYKLMFEDQLRKWEQDQLNSARPSGLYTQSSSTAGGKAPSTVKITNDNLEQLVEEALNKGGQGA